MTTPTAEESRWLLDRLTGYTEGPWQRAGWQPCGIYGPGDLMKAPRIASMDSRAHHDGNARLIAAAPDLVTHLRAALDREAAFRAVLEGACYGDLDGISKMGVEHGRCLGECVAAMTVELRSHAEKAEAERDALRALALRAFTVVEWVVGEGYSPDEPCDDPDDLLLDLGSALGVEDTAAARKALAKGDAQ